ncbi:uncharacterized protein LOC117112216 [Anneissia japonica]|uniref:uncharacterized protein LOC117112216 n=1 Tax=Anneissia japonica TaxID=1529436 RepID=UPI0014258724|nr:uncharacterized protein LOC117112216 [Anneissia japonica]
MIHSLSLSSAVCSFFTKEDSFSCRGVTHQSTSYRVEGGLVHSWSLARLAAASIPFKVAVESTRSIMQKKKKKHYMLNMSEDDLFKRIVQFLKMKSTEICLGAQHSSPSANAIHSTVVKTIQERSEFRGILLKSSEFLMNQNNDLDKNDKTLVEIGKFLGLICSRIDLLADESLCEMVVKCLISLSTLNSATHLQVRVSNWAKSRLRHLLCDESESGTSYVVKVCGFDATMCNNMRSEMTTSYLREGLNNLENDKEFCQLLLSLDIGKLLYIPQASNIVKTVLHHRCITNDTKHLIAVANNESSHDQDGYVLDCILARMWLEDLQMFETAIVDLIDSLLQVPNLSCSQRQQLIKNSKITKACTAHPALKKAAENILDYFKGQSKGCPLVVTAVNDFNHSIREMEYGVQLLSKTDIT